MSILSRNAAGRGTLLRAFLIGGAVAGTLDISSAVLLAGMRVFPVIAGGLLGRNLPQTVWVNLLGITLHYVIAFTGAAVFCLASRKLTFLTRHWLVCGLTYGMQVYLFMNLVVLPLSAYHRTGPFVYHTLVRDMLILMFVYGLPLAFMVHRIAPATVEG